MNKKLIYINFSKKKRVNFISFIVYRIFNFLFEKFKTNLNSEFHNDFNKKHISK